MIKKVTVDECMDGSVIVTLEDDDGSADELHFSSAQIAREVARAILSPVGE